MRSLILTALTLSLGATLPSVADAAPGFATGNVNMRSGPSTQYPRITTLPEGVRVDIRGCMTSRNWCDVVWRGYRGWVSASYLQSTYSQRRVPVGPRYYRPLGIPSITFSIDRYWRDHYRDRDFYRDRDRWRDRDSWRDRDRRHDRDRDWDRDRREGRRDGGRPDRDVFSLFCRQDPDCRARLDGS